MIWDCLDGKLDPDLTLVPGICLEKETLRRKALLCLMVLGDIAHQGRESMITRSLASSLFLSWPISKQRSELEVDQALLYLSLVTSVLQLDTMTQRFHNL